MFLTKMLEMSRAHIMSSNGPFSWFIVLNLKLMALHMTWRFTLLTQCVKVTPWPLLTQVHKTIIIVPCQTAHKKLSACKMSVGMFLAMHWTIMIIIIWLWNFFLCITLHGILVQYSPATGFLNNTYNIQTLFGDGNFACLFSASGMVI